MENRLVVVGNSGLGVGVDNKGGVRGSFCCVVIVFYYVCGGGIGFYLLFNIYRIMYYYV